MYVPCGCSHVSLWSVQIFTTLTFSFVVVRVNVFVIVSTRRRTFRFRQESNSNIVPHSVRLPFLYNGKEGRRWTVGHYLCLFRLLSVVGERSNESRSACVTCSVSFRRFFSVLFFILCILLPKRPIECHYGCAGSAFGNVRATC